MLITLISSDRQSANPAPAPPWRVPPGPRPGRRRIRPFDLQARDFATQAQLCKYCSPTTTRKAKERFLGPPGTRPEGWMDDLLLDHHLLCPSFPPQYIWYVIQLPTPNITPPLLGLRVSPAAPHLGLRCVAVSATGPTGRRPVCPPLPASDRHDTVIPRLTNPDDDFRSDTRIWMRIPSQLVLFIAYVLILPFRHQDAGTTTSMAREDGPAVDYWHAHAWRRFPYFWLYNHRLRQAPSTVQSWRSRQ